MPRKELPANLPALTDEELRDIGLRVRNQDVKDLLWEIARLRRQVLHSYQLALQLPFSHEGHWHTWLQKLEGEPCVIEALEGDYGSKTPGTRGCRGEVRTPEHEVQLGKMKAEAKARIAKRRERTR
ncbi:hypothetical protein Tamer19_72520 [Cupriavidus sp. TA19]|uniref:hypothetical protein n=1 Tax=Cupriavidus sp. TA19 TaxID=701108 RepID=UPI0027294BA4|nr:hypothetical protein [Cupriavidus sp. TA19]GLC97843.1 hypothetical protein Tamer19_72520 [Cupriavidus sp. TA19]